jgi:hypothetical protein
VPPVGDGVLPDWTAIVHALALMKTVGEILAIPGGVAGSAALILRRLKARSGAAAEAVKARSPHWYRMGADPYAFEEWITGGVWRREEIAVVIDYSKDEAEAILWAFGLASSEDKSWRGEPSEEARLLADNMRMMIRMSISQANGWHPVPASEAPSTLDYVCFRTDPHQVLPGRAVPRSEGLD